MQFAVLLVIIKDNKIGVTCSMDDNGEVRIKRWFFNQKILLHTPYVRGEITLKWSKHAVGIYIYYIIYIYNII